MSKYYTEEFKCIHCGNSQNIDVYSSINGTIDPKLKQLIMTNEFNLLTCKKCKNTYPININLLYHDMSNKYMIYLVNPETEKQLPKDMLLDNYRLRIVRNRNEMIEKIRIFDDSRSDFLIELLKIIVKNNDENHIKLCDLFYNGFKRGLIGNEYLSLLQVDGIYLKKHKLNIKKIQNELILKYSNDKFTPRSIWLEVNEDYVLIQLESEGSIKKLDTINVHILDPLEGYTKEKWLIGRDISHEKYNEFKDLESGDIFIVNIHEPIKPIDNVDNFDSLIDALEEKSRSSEANYKFVSEKMWKTFKNEFD